MAFWGFRLYNPCCDIFYIHTLWCRLANSHPSRADVLDEAVMSVDHHLVQIASVSLAEGVLRSEQKRSRRASFLRYQSLLHRNRVQNPNDCSSKARIELMLMKVDVKWTEGGVVGEQEHLQCEEAKELSGSLQDR